MASSIGGSALTALQKLHQSASNVTAPTWSASMRRPSPVKANVVASDQQA